MFDVLAIGQVNDRVHAGTSETILTHVGDDTETCRAAWAEFELYDPEGVRLEIVDGAEEGDPPRLQPSDGLAANPHHLVDRVALVLAAHQVILNADPDPQIPDGRFPELRGSLPVVLAGLVAFYGPLPHFEVPPHPVPGPHNWDHQHGINHA